MKSGNGETRVNLKRRKEFELLTREHIDALWRTAFRMTGSQDLADEITQETCLKAYVAFEQYKHGTNYKAWIFRILTNLCRDHIRRESKGLFKVWDNEEVDAVSEDVGEIHRPDRQLQQQELYTHSISAMKKLPPDIRVIVCLSLLDGLTYKEIAEDANIPIGTVRSRLNKGRKLLQDLLKAHVADGDTEASVKKNAMSFRLTSESTMALMNNKKTELLK